MIPILLATASALVWGTADYAGGRVSRRIDALRVAVLSKLFSLPLLGLYLVLMPAAAAPVSLAWGVAAGIVGLAALVTFYRALSSGAMSVVAPVSAVTTAVLPLAFGLLTGDRPGALALAGVGCAIAGIGLVSLVGGGGAGPGGRAARDVGLALAAGTGFGLFFVLLDRSNAAAAGDPGLWPVAAAQAGAVLLGLVLLAVRRRDPASGRVTRGRLLAWVTGAGVLDMSANALYLIAVRDGMLSIVAPLAALYPVSTVLLALLLDRERIRPVQVAGLGFAVAALVLVAA